MFYMVAIIPLHRADVPFVWTVSNSFCLPESLTNCFIRMVYDGVK